MNGTHVEDLLRSGNLNFKEICKETHKRFETSGAESTPPIFTVSTLTTQSDDLFIMNQTPYLKKLKNLETTCNFREFRPMRIKLAWLTNTRPDLQLEISQVAQVTVEIPTKDVATNVKRLNLAIRYTQNNAVHLLYPKLDLRSVRIVGYSDAAFANN